MKLTSRSLPVRLAALMTLAMFPLGAIALLQTREVVDNSVALSRAALLAETDQVTAVERERLQRAIGIAEGLGSAMIPILRDPSACSATLSDFIDAHDEFVMAAFIDTDGRMDCSSTGVPMNFAGSASMEQALAEQKPRFTVHDKGAVSGLPVVVASAPVFSDNGLRGFLALSMLQNAGQTYAALDPALSDIDFVTVNRLGEVVSSTSDVETAQRMLPDSLSVDVLFGSIGTTFEASSLAGRSRYYAVSLMIPENVIVIGSWPVENGIASLGSANLAATIAFPILMWMTGIVVAFFGLHRLVVRHVFRMNAAMRRFSRGQRGDIALKLEDPPAEFEILENSYNELTSRLAEAEQRAEEDLLEKTVLLREVHHRVKNNLQLIASIMNMHGRTAQTPEARRLLSQLQRRVRGLASVHQTLDSTSAMTFVDCRSLIAQLVNELVPSIEVAGQSVEIITDIDAVQLGQDQAVTLSMLVAEALTNAVKYVGAPKSGRPTISVSFKQVDASDVSLCIGNTKGTTDLDLEAETYSTGIGRRLMRAFIAQLEGRESILDTDEEFRMEIQFPVMSFDPDPPAALPCEEERVSPDDSAQ